MLEGHASFFRFGPFRLYAPDLHLVCRETPVRLTPKSLQTLLILVRNQGRVVSKEQLLQEVWPETFVDESILAHNVCAIRRALSGGNSDENHYIQTIPKLGYRFAPHVECCAVPQRTASLAVLPFRGAGLAEEEEWIRFGLADAITTRLANIRDLTVRPTSSVVGFAGDNHLSVDAGKHLGTTTILEGLLRKSENRVRLTLQMVDVATRRVQWGEQFDADADELLLLEDRIAERVIAALPVTVGENDLRRARKSHTDNLQAYALRLKAHHGFYHPSAGTLQESMRLLKHSVDCDGNYALAYSDLALCHQLLVMFGAVRPTEAAPLAKTAATKALQLDAELADARAALAFLQWHYDFDWDGAEHQLRTVLQLTPNDPRMRDTYAMLLAETGRYDSAMQQLKKALEIDPSFIHAHADKAMVFAFSGRFDEALKSCRTALQLDPECFRARWMAGVVQTQRGNFREAIRHLRRAAEQSHDHPSTLAGLVHAYCGNGNRQKAAEVVQKLEEMGERQYVSASEMAVAYAGIGDIDGAFESLFRAVEERAISLVLTKVDPQLHCLRSDPRFAEILSRIGLGNNR